MDTVYLLISQLGFSSFGVGIVLFLALLFSCFFRFIAILSIFRWGLGIKGLAFGFVTFGLALGLTYFVMYPQIERVALAASTVVGKSINPSEELKLKALEAGAESWKEFLAKNTDPVTMQSFVQRSGSAPEAAVSWRVVAPAFLVSELRHGTSTALKIILPFLAIDILLALIITGLGIENFSVATVAVPLKLLILVAADGWNLIAQGLLKIYG